MGGWKNYKKRKISLLCWGLVFGEEERGGKKTAELRKEVARGGQGPQGVRGGRLETTLLHPFTHSRMDLIVWGISYENHFAFFFFFPFPFWLNAVASSFLSVGGYFFLNLLSQFDPLLGFYWFLLVIFITHGFWAIVVGWVNVSAAHGERYVSLRGFSILRGNGKQMK